MEEDKAALMPEPWKSEWKIDTDGAMRSLVLKGYIIRNYEITDGNWIHHMMGKRWVDMNTFIPAYFHALKTIGVDKLTVLTYYEKNVK